MRTHAFTFIASVLIASVLVGCMPKSVTIELNRRPPKIDERVVLTDTAPTGKIAQIDVTGVITQTPTTAFGPGPSILDDVAAMLAKAADDEGVQGVLLRINSPGGSVAASESLANMIETFRQRTGKPVVASMGEVAASGGYLTAIAADRIVAQPGSITGSIGVIVPTLNVSEGMSRLGIHARSVVSGPNKDLASPLEPPVDEHYAILQGIVDEFYQEFRDRVVVARPNLKDLDTTLDGRVFTGRRAQELGLVDHLGGIEEAFLLTKRLAGLEGARLVKYYRGGSPPLTPYASSNASAGNAEAPAGTLADLARHLDRPAGQSAAVNAGFYYLWLPPGGLSFD